MYQARGIFYSAKVPDVQGERSGADGEANAAWTKIELPKKERSISVGCTENNQVTCWPIRRQVIHIGDVGAG